MLFNKVSVGGNVFTIYSTILVSEVIDICKCQKPTKANFIH